MLNVYNSLLNSLEGAAKPRQVSSLLDASHLWEIEYYKHLQFW